ncbi:helix-turn-helix domain-containing protein [Halomicrococcus sp. SG-WS-1]|uniref:helix-turn-helix domain-containing protein n=1 Tax=Halomicrococcus sp. SG-WS-1 TaxID=3439057 RepID=UPI003F7B2ABC
MTESMSGMLQKDMQCEGLLECFHDLKEIDTDIFQLLHERQSPLTVDEIAEQVERERSTAYRAVQRLLETGLIQKEQVNYEQGGYYHVYRLRYAKEIPNEMQRTLNDWYAQMVQLIGEFNDRYSEETQPAAPVES